MFKQIFCSCQTHFPQDLGCVCQSTFKCPLFISILLLFTSDGPDIVGGIQFELKTAPNVDPPVFQLTCTSSTAPATTVQWSKDGSPVSGGSSSQIVNDTVEATYINELTVTGRQSGTYNCTVTTWRAYRDDQGPDTMLGSPVTASIAVEGERFIATTSFWSPNYSCSYYSLINL